MIAEIAEALRGDLDRTDAFVSIERFHGLGDPLLFWRDADARI